MRLEVALFPLMLVHVVSGQRLDPDQNPNWTRYTFVEDSSTLVPMKGDYQVYYIQSGMWWNMLPLHFPVVPSPEEEVRLLSVFGEGFPALLATPARGRDYPDVKVVAVRDVDTMVVELSVYYEHRGSEVHDRCAHLDCRRRPPVVLPFRKGRYLANGRPFAKDRILTGDAENKDDERTATLTEQFDVLWARAMKEDRVIPQLNTDTCRYEVAVAGDLDVPDTCGVRNTDLWLMRSYYCGTHLARFPGWGTETAYTITGGPGSGVDTSGKGAHLHFSRQEEEKQWLDLTGWPPGDYTVSLVACGNGGSFILKLR